MKNTSLINKTLLQNANNDLYMKMLGIEITAGYAACAYGHYVSTVSGNMNYIKPAMNTNYIYCIGQVVRQGKQISVYNVELYDDNGNILETGSFTFFTLNREV